MLSVWGLEYMVEQNEKMFKNKINSSSVWGSDTIEKDEKNMISAVDAFTSKLKGLPAKSWKDTLKNEVATDVIDALDEVVMIIKQSFFVFLFSCDNVTFFSCDNVTL